MPSPLQTFLQDLDRTLADGAPQFDAILQQLCTLLDCTVGTIHQLDAKGMLQLKAQRGLPPVLLDKVNEIPVGKGMAGIAAERRQPVQVCNLQTDASGVVRPGAKLTRMEGSLACPMLMGQRLFGVLGVAKPVEYEFSPEETQFVMRVGERIAQALAVHC
jgi:L-methionine (R)-S-oxide reductase